MKPAPFLYTRPRDLDEALATLREHGDDARVLAGGQSLLPMMNFRLARPAVLVDLQRVAELQGMRREDGTLQVGAMTRQREAEVSAEAGAACPLLHKALPWIGHLQNRNLGTIGGSVAHADPAAELPAVAVALDAEVCVANAIGTRSVPAREFFAGPFMTALAADELVTAVRFPVEEDAAAVCLEVAPRHGDFAVVGVAARVRFAADGAVQRAGIAAFGVDGTPVRLTETEGVIRGTRLTSDIAAEAGAAAASEVPDPTADIHATGGYRSAALAALVRRAVDQLSRSTP